MMILEGITISASRERLKELSAIERLFRQDDLTKWLR
jgi:hypothetical protein